MNTDNDCPRYRPFSLPNVRIKVRKAKYSTSLDSRGYIPVYEYTINNQPIMWDRETGYVHFTGIWKALGNSKSDIVKMVDSNPELKVKKIRGGFLKIQGTWIPYDFASILCKRTAWHIRKELIALFGPRFSNEALDPMHEDYGCLLLDPKKAPLTSRHNHRRHMTTSTTMKQVRQHHQPYPTNNNKCQQQQHNQKMVSSFKKQNKKNKEKKEKGKKEKHAIITNNMSLSRLLNDNNSEDYIQSNRSDSFSSISSFSSFSSSSSSSSSSSFQLLSPLDDTSVSEDDISSDHTTPSPTFHTTLPHLYDHHNQKWKSPNMPIPFLPSIIHHDDSHSSSSSSSSSSYYSSSFSSSSAFTQSHDGDHTIHSIYSKPNHQDQHHHALLPKITPIYPSYWHHKKQQQEEVETIHTSSSPSSYSTALNQDIIDTINATILLQRLSQDDGARPFRPMSSSIIPSRVVVGDQEYKICWDS
ncbi:hypothetical protein BJ944DRAFT_229910 [Cunninghamella echinulata]|nr:hypothetical protein BJ944DRAFT_229910 [Cunninghamella echinulata]